MCTDGGSGIFFLDMPFLHSRYLDLSRQWPVSDPSRRICASWLHLSGIAMIDHAVEGLTSFLLYFEYVFGDLVVAVEM